MGSVGRLSVQSHAPPARNLRDRHAAAHGERLAARRARLLLYAHRPRRAVSSDAGQRSLLPDGVGRQRPADRAARAELLRRALRSVAALRSFLRPARAAAEAADFRFAAQFHRAVHAADGRRRESVRASVEIPGSVGRLVDDLRDDRCARAAGLAGGVSSPARARARVPGRGADALGRGLQNGSRPGRARRPRGARRVSPRPVCCRRSVGRRSALCGNRHDASGVDPGLRRARGAS